MTAIIRNQFRVFNAKKFIESLGGSNSLYLGIGRPYFWNLGTSDDTVPAGLPLNNLDGTNSEWEDMLSLKRITQSDVSHGIFKEVWATNVKYDVFRNDWDGATIASVYNGSNPSVAFPTSAAESKCYVVTDTFDIYACVKQKIIAGVVQPSTNSPITGTPVGTNTGMYQTADGYVWKYIASTSAADVVKFTTTQFTPIKTLTADPGAGDYANQWLQQGYSAALAGGIYHIQIGSGGSGYNFGFSTGTYNVTNAKTDTYFKVRGNGTGLQLSVTLASGVITDILVTNPGSGYTYATVTAAGGGSGATFTIYFTPMWGLGADPVRDLNAYFMIADCKLISTESGIFTTTNEYRKIALVANPTNYGTSTISTATNLDASTVLTLSGVSNTFGSDGVVTASGGAVGRTVDWDSGTSKLRLIRTRNENNGIDGGNVAFGTSQTVSTTIGSGTGTISTVTNPTVQPNSGDVIYIEYRRPVSRSVGQTEDLKIVVEM